MKTAKQQQKEANGLLHKALLEVEKLSKKQIAILGICGEVYYALCNMRECEYEGVVKQIPSDLFKKWPEFSGDIYYPVPSCSTELNAKEAYNTLPRWYTGEYAAARLRLLDYLIEQTK